MEGDRTSEAVVIPDITEPLTNETEEHGTLTSDHHPSVTPIAVPVASVPVTLPVGSVIGVASTGTTFNVITPDQLQLSSTGHFKPVLCVDNSFICDARGDKEAETIRTWVRSAQNGWEQATHIVIQGEPLVTADVTPAPANVASTPATTVNCPTTWNESVHLPVLPVRCKNTSAELHKARFGSGGRGRCIKLGENWYTPSEFEALCGRASSKDWKRSIRFGGRSLQTLVDESILTPHATSCTCSACCDDDTATGPIRLFTPYKRRKRKNTDEGCNKMKRSSSKDNNSQSNDDESDSDIKVGIDEWVGSPLHTSSGATTPSSQPAITTLTSSTSSTTTATFSEQARLGDIVVVTTSSSNVHTTSVPSNVSTEAERSPRHNTVNSVGVVCETSSSLSAIAAKQKEAFKKLDEMAGKLLKMAHQFKSAIEETKDQCHQELEHLKNEKEAAVMAARVEVQKARDVFDQRTETSLPVHVVDPLEPVELQPTADSGDVKRCANCNRKALAECSLCRQTPYCSTFCQRKDWSSHQVECVRGVAAVATTADHTGSIMLIVESSDQVMSPDNITHTSEG